MLSLDDPNIQEKILRIQEILGDLPVQRILAALQETDGDENSALDRLLSGWGEGITDAIEQEQQQTAVEPSKDMAVEKTLAEIEFEQLQNLRNAIAVCLNHSEWFGPFMLSLKVARFVRRAALELLEHIQVKDPQLVLLVIKMALGDSDNLVQVKAGAALEKLGASVEEMFAVFQNQPT